MHRRLVALSWVALTTLACGPSAPPGEIALPGPGLGDLPERADRAAAVQRACEQCHPKIVEEWRRSYHHLSFTNLAFRASLSEENVPFCRRCHAPEAPSDTWPPEDLADIGVGCATCHMAGHAILAAPSNRPSKSPHAIVRDPRFATPAACAACHEFAFPPEKGRPRDLDMQTTVTEHKDSPYSDRSCADCHMPWVGDGKARHRSHAFASTRSPAAQAEALHIEASRTGGAVHILLSPGEVGHAYPTGDMFRRLAVRAEAVTTSGALLARRERYLARHFDRRRGPGGEPEISLAWDDRPGSPLSASKSATVDFDLGPSSLDCAISVQVVFERVAKTLEGRPERDAPVESAQVLFDALLPPSDSAPPQAPLPTSPRH